MIFPKSIRLLPETTLLTPRSFEVLSRVLNQHMMSQCLKRKTRKKPREEGICNIDMWCQRTHLDFSDSNCTTFICAVRYLSLCISLFLDCLQQTCYKLVVSSRVNPSVQESSHLVCLYDGLMSRFSSIKWSCVTCIMYIRCNVPSLSACCESGETSRS